MKTDLTLQQMAVELDRRQATKRDFVTSTSNLIVNEQTNELNLTIPKGVLTLNAGEIFREQAESHYKIPRDYAERIRRDHPALFARTLNNFFTREPVNRMVRVLDGNARAFLSDRYRPLDDFDLANAVLPVLMDHPTLRVESTSFTDRRFYIKAILPKLEAEVKVGDAVQMGIVISNSEVGAGALQVAPLIYRLVCKNGMISPDYGQRRYHVGKRASAEEDAYELYTDKTRAADDKAFFLKVGDTVRGVLTQEVLGKLVDKMRVAAGNPIEAKAIAHAVEVTAERFGYNDATQSGILEHLIRGGDLTQYGLMNAVTRQSQDEANYELATKMEADGGKIIELPRQDWQAIAQAA